MAELKAELAVSAVSWHVATRMSALDTCFTRNLDVIPSILPVPPAHMICKVAFKTCSHLD